MFTYLLFILFTALFIVINIVLGCWIAVRFGYGPPDWRTALNLVVRITVLQWRLNSWREFIDRKFPWADRQLTRLHVPKPIVIIEKIDDAELEKELDIPPAPMEPESPSPEPPPESAPNVDTEDKQPSPAESTK